MKHLTTALAVLICSTMLAIGFTAAPAAAGTQHESVPAATVTTDDVVAASLDGTTWHEVVASVPATATTLAETVALVAVDDPSTWQTTSAVMWRGCLVSVAIAAATCGILYVIFR